MKIHITNLYNFNHSDEMVKLQHHFAEVGGSLGFREMGIFEYPVETDTPSELSKRLDGVLAALEQEDLVFIQLPTKNGFEYEQRLINKIKAYQNTRIVLILHDMQMFHEALEKDTAKRYISLYQRADAVIVPSARYSGLMEMHGFLDVLYGDDYYLLQNDFYLKKLLLDAVEKVYSVENRIVQKKSLPVEEKIHIGFGLHDKTGNYSMWVGTAMLSIMEHTNVPICFHIVHDETLNEKNKRKFLQLAASGKQEVCFHLLDKELFQKITNQMGIYTIGALFRVVLPQLLPQLSKIIYLDADILVNRDIRELWETDIDEYYMAAVADVDVVSGVVRPLAVKRGEVLPEQYFNSGVLYMNLDAIRAKGNMRDEIVDYLQNAKESNLPDQDALNAVYKEKILLLDGSWNCFVRPLQNRAVKGLEKKIYHFVGTRCILYSLADVDRLFYETVAKTPWGEDECRRILDKSLRRVTDRMKHLEKLLTECAGKRKRYVFYGDESFSMLNLYKLLSPQEGDYRVLASPKEQAKEILPCRELTYLAEEKEDFLVFVLPEADGGTAPDRLDKLGLVREKDYFIIPLLLPPSQGGYM